MRTDLCHAQESAELEYYVTHFNFLREMLYSLTESSKERLSGPMVFYDRTPNRFKIVLSQRHTVHRASGSKSHERRGAVAPVI